MVANAPAGLASGRKHFPSGTLVLLAGSAVVALGCEIESLFISAGAPVTAAVEGRISDCGAPVVGAVLVFRVQQNEPGQSRPVDVEIRPATTSRDGRYLVEVSPAFAVPGPARIQLRTINGVSLELTGPNLQFNLGSPAQDTLRFDADLRVHLGTCLSG
ncbi:MAG TPA: hypothetical protein VFZ87_00090 [Gemmatimonadales bacterium]